MNFVNCVHAVNCGLEIYIKIRFLFSLIIIVPPRTKPPHSSFLPLCLTAPPFALGSITTAASTSPSLCYMYVSCMTLRSYHFCYPLFLRLFASWNIYIITKDLIEELQYTKTAASFNGDLNTLPAPMCHHDSEHYGLYSWRWNTRELDCLRQITLRSAMQGTQPNLVNCRDRCSQTAVIQKRLCMWKQCNRIYEYYKRILLVYCMTCLYGDHVMLLTISFIVDLIYFLLFTIFFISSFLIFREWVIIYLKNLKRN